MSELLAAWGLEALKPLATALVLPPTPLMALVLWGAWMLARQRRWGWLWISSALASMWLTSSLGFARILESQLIQIPPPLSNEQISELRTTSRPTAIVVLGGGRDSFAPEYRNSDLSGSSLERLRYGIWLARATGLPLAFSGGTGWGQVAGDSEAQIAARVAQTEFNFQLTWVETQSRDTRENASLTLPIMSQAGMERLIVVTSGWHMPRALSAFEAAALGTPISIEPASMGLGTTIQTPHTEWIPTSEGFSRMRRTGKELLGKALGF